MKKSLRTLSFKIMTEHTDPAWESILALAYIQLVEI